MCLYSVACSAGRPGFAAAKDSHKNAFARQRNFFHWLACNLVAYPRNPLSYVQFTAKSNGIGYLYLDPRRSGFRPEWFIELWSKFAVAPPIPRDEGLGSLQTADGRFALRTFAGVLGDCIALC